MHIFTKNGLNKLRECAIGKAIVIITGDITPYVDEVSVLLTKLSYLFGKPMDSLFASESRGYTIGNLSMSETIISGTELFEHFEVTHISDDISSEHINTRNTGVCYSKSIGEAMSYNKVFGTYTCNDGMVLAESMFSRSDIVYLKKDCMSIFMPDFYKETQNTEKMYNAKLLDLGLFDISEGSKVQIRPYSELAEKFGEQVIVLDDTDNAILVDSSEDPDAVRFIRTLGYSKLSADYYDNKVGTIVSIDMHTCSLILDIDGKTTHDIFLDDGNIYHNTEDAIVFTLEHIKKVEDNDDNSVLS